MIKYCLLGKVIIILIIIIKIMIISMQSKLSVRRRMENFVLPRMAVCGIYMYYTFITRRMHGRFYRLDFAIDMLDSSMMKKTAADL